MSSHKLFPLTKPVRMLIIEMGVEFEHESTLITDIIEKLLKLL